MYEKDANGSEWVSSPCDASVPVSELSQVGEARRLVAKITLDMGFNDEQRGNAAIIVSELATNLARYARDGQILMHVENYGESRRLNILSIDRGPGIENISRCLADGYSTGGTPGNGFGAVSRLSSEFDIFSTVPGGTIVFSRLTSHQGDFKSSPFQWACVSRPAPHEVFCGDACRIVEKEDLLQIVVVDGLGHGPLAAAAAEEAVQAFGTHAFNPLDTILKHANTRMQGTRGGAIAIAEMNSSLKSLKYLGMGNIAGSVRAFGSERGRGLVSHNGTVGTQLRPLKEFEYDCPAGSLMIMHSDGLQSRWSLETYPGLDQRHPGVVAGILLRDFTRGPDDVTVAVVRSRMQRD